MSQPTARESSRPVPVPVPVLVPVAVHSICPRPIVSLGMIGPITCSRDIMTPGKRRSKGIARSLLVICFRYCAQNTAFTEIWVPKSRFLGTSNAQLLRSDPFSAVSSHSRTFRWKYLRGEEQNESKRGAHAVVYLPMRGICSHFPRINSRLLEFAPNLLQI
jgi:hypothetical protein